MVDHFLINTKTISNVYKELSPKQVLQLLELASRSIGHTNSICTFIPKKSLRLFIEKEIILSEFSGEKSRFYFSRKYFLSSDEKTLFIPLDFMKGVSE